MEDLAKYPRLFKRGNRYYIRAAVPADIKEEFGKAEVTYSLKTSNYKEAIQRLTIESAKVDAQFEGFRQKLVNASQPAVYRKALSKREIQYFADRYFQSFLEADDERRFTEGFVGFNTLEINASEQGEVDNMLGLIDGMFSSPNKQARAALPSTRDAFNDKKAETLWYRDQLKEMLARGEIEDDVYDDMREMLAMDDVNIQLDEDGESWNRLAIAFMRALVEAYDVIAARYDGEAIETPERQLMNNHQVIPSAIAAQQPSIPTITSSKPLLSDAMEEWIRTAKKDGNGQKYLNTMRATMTQFISVVGDKPFDTYNKADVRAYKAVLEKIPPNWNKLKPFKHLPIAKAAEKAHELGFEPISNATFNKALTVLGAFWEYQKNQYDGLIYNPFTGMKLKEKKNPREARYPFTEQELQTIFNGSLYTGCRSIKQYAKPGELIPKESALYWVPLIGLYSGMRLGEILQLTPDDIKTKDGIFYFDVNDSKNKRLKTDSSKRKIPIHPKLIALGLMTIVNKQWERQARQLFDDVPKSRDGYSSSVFGKKFKYYLESLGVKHKKNGFHSFRHNFEDACREADVPYEVMNALQGHTVKGMSATYGSGHTLAKLAENVEKIVYPITVK